MPTVATHHKLCIWIDVFVLLVGAYAWLVHFVIGAMRAHCFLKGMHATVGEFEASSTKYEISIWFLE